MNYFHRICCEQHAFSPRQHKARIQFRAPYGVEEKMLYCQSPLGIDPRIIIYPNDPFHAGRYNEALKYEGGVRGVYPIFCCMGAFFFSLAVTLYRICFILPVFIHKAKSEWNDAAICLVLTYNINFINNFFHSNSS